MLSTRTTILLSILMGVLLETVIHVVTGRSEAWDSGLYWTAGLPLAGVAAAVIGYLSRGRDWLWTLLIVPGQVMTMIMRSDGISGLLPLMVILSAILSLPFAIIAFIGSRFRRAG